MKETKRILIREVTSKFKKLSREDQRYITGVMDGILINAKPEQSESNDTQAG